MKQVIKEVETEKAYANKLDASTSAEKSNKSEELARIEQTQKTNLFNRFLEASCDCV